MAGLEGKSVLITGASRGIGATAARRFADAGARVMLLARSETDIAVIAAEITAAGGSALARVCNVARYTDMASAVEAANAAFGSVDVLIGNAGVIGPIERLAGAAPDAFSEAIDINLKGVFHGMRAVLPVMRAQGGGTILTVSSGAAHSALEGWGAYCASKAGAAMLTMCADTEERENGIRVMGLSPGTVATRMQREIKASGVNPISALDWAEHISPDWPAQALIWMCSPDADEFIGQEISLRDADIRRRVGLVE